jgi:hypothetical protein
MSEAGRYGLAACVGVLIAGFAVSPAFAQADLTGYYNPLMHEDQFERTDGGLAGRGLEVGDYLGLPINDAARMRADTWSASLLTVPEHQCKPHPSTYGFRGVGLLRIWYDVDEGSQRLIKINTHIQWQEQRREIWMDGRPHPPEYAAHTWQGFSTGRFEKGVLRVRTTHLKAGYIRRNGVPLSDRATMTELFFRHGDNLTHVSMIEDPVYLTETIVRSNGFRLNPAGQMAPYPCWPAVEVVREKGVIPHYLPGMNPSLTAFARRFNLPVETTRGGAETALPEYAKRLKALTAAPARTASSR